MLSIAAYLSNNIGIWPLHLNKNTHLLVIAVRYKCYWSKHLLIFGKIEEAKALSDLKSYNFSLKLLLYFLIF